MNRQDRTFLPQNLRLSFSLKKLLFIVAFLPLSQLLWGQSESSDFMRSTGKIYVVVAVIIAIFIGIVLFLIFLDRKLTKLENQIKEHD
ncbi:MAG: CcmD family protein [Phaeodactylibacter sp.]|nr:CcmD family protein [Phaeodactylibacter sp.]MCB9303811.1 CcmD family protein [Lewinellaceae bacterium]HQU58184.1 CcmD family protein [Saprospiraceae bacterium]